MGYIKTVTVNKYNLELNCYKMPCGAPIAQLRTECEG